MNTKINVKPIKSVLVDTDVSDLNRFLILDSQFEILFDSINNLAAKICKVPVAIITLVDDHRIWYKSEAGYSYVTDIPKSDLFCGLVSKKNEYLEIHDIDQDELHKDHDFDLDGKKFRFYAGAPVKLPLGEVIGVIGVFDTKPKTLTSQQREVLLGLADILTKALVTKHFLSRVVN